MNNPRSTGSAERDGRRARWTGAVVIAVVVLTGGGVLASDLGILPAAARGPAARSPDSAPIASTPTDSEPGGPSAPVEPAHDALTDVPKGPPRAAIAGYLAPVIGPLPNADPGLATRGPRPTLRQLAVTYQYGDPFVMTAPGAGESDWRLAHPDQRAVRGYGSAISVNPGATLDLMLRGTDPMATLDVFRMGLGDGRHVLTVPNVAIPDSTEAVPDPATGVVEERWPVADRLAIDPLWTSGVYLIKLTGSSGGQSYILFIVRPARPGALTVVLPTMTYQAYNAYGGPDLYGWPGGRQRRAYAVSYDRPFDEQFGAGLLFRLDFPLIVWLEDHGYRPDYVADADLARDPTLLDRVRTLVFSGHGEYWTRTMRDHVEAAAQAGTNLAFFGANQAFWQTRLHPASTGAADRVMICYKSASLDPVAGLAPSDATVRFTDPPVNRPSQSFIGQKYGGIVKGLLPLTIGPGITAFAPDIGLVPGEQLPGLVGEEVDELHHSFTGLALGMTRLTVVEHPGDILVGATVWQRPTGGRVFDAGTFDYSWGLDPRYAGALPGFNDEAFTQLTARILGWLGALPGS